MIKKLVVNPLQKFIHIESFSGILLFAATIIALVWANSPYGYLYESLWHYKLGVETSGFQLVKPLILWINDGLMAVFFFLIGLEIKRELTVGELNTPTKAVFPVFAAVGGMAFPALLFILFNSNPAALQGWAIPMATDIAFSLAIIKLLGNRVPLNLKIFLTAFAIVDDLGAVVIIALFYSTGIQWLLIGIAFTLLVLLFVLSARNMFSKYALVVVGSVIWYLFLKAGVHPTIAGVLLAFTVPLRQKVVLAEVIDELGDIVQKMKYSSSEKAALLTKEQIEHIDAVEDWVSKVQSPLQHLEHRLHNWVAYCIMPIFALANAGVSIQSTTAIDYSLVVLLTTALVVGNCIGVSLMSFIAHKSGVSVIPNHVNGLHIVGAAFLAGVGFTMSIFIANLAFADNPALLNSSKIGILIGSSVSGLIGYVILRFGKRNTTNTAASMSS